MPGKHILDKKSHS